jgi:uncharacterized ion transporter superfamily protein YfcC
MKKNNMTLLFAVIVMSAVFSYFIAGAVFNDKKVRQQKTEVVEKITSTFPDAYSDRYKVFFNKDSLNPTQVITIGGTNPAPTPPVVTPPVIKR